MRTLADRSYVAAQLRDQLRGLEFDFASLPAEPFYISARTVQALTVAAHHLIRLLRQAIVMCGSSAEDRLRALNAVPDDHPLFTADPIWEVQYCDPMARPDIVFSAQEPKFVEFNISGAVGGVPQTQQVLVAWDRLLSDDARRTNPSRPADARARYFRDLRTQQEDARPVPIVASRHDLGSDRPMEIEVAALKRVGLTGLNLCPEDIPSVLNDENMSRCLGSGLRYFTVPEWREIGIELCPLVEALRSGRLTLLPSQTSYLLANKRVMAWLSRGLPWMSAVDRQVVDRYLPWTREIHPGQVDLYGKSVDLEKLLARHQERFVIKKNVGMKAEQVAIGHDATASQWRQELNDAFENDDAVAQEYHSVDTYELAMWPDGARRCSVPVRPVWNPFFFGRHFGGFGVRYSLTSGHDPISSGHGALANAAHEY